MRPRSIAYFEMLGWTATGLGVLRVLIAIIMMASARPAPPASLWFGQVFLLLLFAGIGVVTFLVSKKRHDVARGAFYVFAVMAVIASFGLGDGGAWIGSLAALLSIIDVLTIGALLGAGIALFQPEAAAHMVPGGIRTPTAPAWGQPGLPGGAGYPPPGAYPGGVATGGQSQPVWQEPPAQSMATPGQPGPQPGQQPPYQPPPSA
jgi:hypothetical protein